MCRVACLSVSPEVAEGLASLEVLQLRPKLWTADWPTRGQTPGLGLQGNVLHCFIKGLQNVIFLHVGKP